MTRPAARTTLGTRFPQWVTPTALAVSWTPLLAATISLAVMVGATSAVAPQAAADVTVLGCGTMVAAVALALDDAARALVQPLPVSARCRLLHRLALLLPVAAIASWLLVIAGRRAFDAVLPPLPPLAAPFALLSAAISIEVWWSRCRPDHEAAAGAATAICWPVAGILLPPELVPASIANGWAIHPWPILAATIPLIVVGTGGITS